MKQNKTYHQYWSAPLSVLYLVICLAVVFFMPRASTDPATASQTIVKNTGGQLHTCLKRTDKISSSERKTVNIQNKAGFQRITNNFIAAPGQFLYPIFYHGRTIDQVSVPGGAAQVLHCCWRI